MSEVNSPADWKRVALQAERDGQIATAVAAWREVLWLRPDDLEVLVGLAACGEIKPAIEGLQAALRRNPDHAEAHYQLGLLWLDAGEWDRAATELAQARDGDATQAALERLKRERGRPGAAYARHLFNDYAPRFEEALARLGYQAPQLIADALKPYLTSSQRILDLGCGTGLMVPYLKPHASRLVGVDIAEKMLTEAQKRGAYDELVAGDMVEHLKGEWDIIVAADAVVYVGDLAPLFAATAQALAPKGVLAMSVEVNGLEEGYALQESKRYAHSLAYIRDLCRSCNLSLLSCKEAVLRQDRNAPVTGAVILIGH